MCEEIIKNPYRRVWACVNLDALHDNLRQIAACRKNDAGIIAVIKADGYGHGAVMLAREMDEIPEVIGYAVATEEEAVLLADAGIKKPAMALGYTFPEAYEEMALRGVHATVFTDQMLEDMNRAAQKAGKKMHVHIAVDTGMSRIGIRPDDEGLSFVARAMQCPNLSIEGIFTHFATADEADKSRTNVQYEKFSSFTDRVEKELSLKIPLRHCSNSASILELPNIIFGLYGTNVVDLPYPHFWFVLVLAAMTVNALEDHNTDLDSPARGISWLMIATVAFAVVPVKDSDTGSWSLGVLKNPGQYCAVLGFGLLGLLLYRYLCQKWRGDSRFAQRMTAAVLGGTGSG